MTRSQGGQSWVEWATDLAWATIEVATVFVKTLMNPEAERGSQGSAPQRRIGTIHVQRSPPGGGNSGGGGGGHRLGGSGSSGSSGSGSGGGGGGARVNTLSSCGGGAVNAGG